MALNIFEPRYRLMVRRCMEGSRRFGMATVGASHTLNRFACECEILECQPQPDGCVCTDSPTLTLRCQRSLVCNKNKNNAGVCARRPSVNLVHF